MNKKIKQSKTIWGFGLLGVIVLAQTLGIDMASHTIAEVVEILAGLFGVYGLRDAL